MLSPLFGMYTWESNGSSRVLTRGVKHQHLHSSLPKIQVYCSSLYSNKHRKWQSSFCAAMQGRMLLTSAPTRNPQAPAVWICQISSEQECEAWVLLQTQIWSPCCPPITAWLFQPVMDDLPLPGVLQRRLDTSPKWEVLIWFLEEILHWEVSSTDLTTLIILSGLKKRNLICNLGVFSICYPDLRLQPCCSFAIT